MPHEAETITALIQTEPDGTEGPVGIMFPRPPEIERPDSLSALFHVVRENG